MSRSLLFVLLLSLVLAFTASTQARTVSERAIDSIINTWVNSVTNAKYENEELADTTSSPGQIAAAFANSKVGSCYSQAQRMSNPCYDCSSLVYLAYKSADPTLKDCSNYYSRLSWKFERCDWTSIANG